MYTAQTCLAVRQQLLYDYYKSLCGEMVLHFAVCFWYNVTYREGM